MVAIEAAKGWTAVSRRHSDGSKPKRRITSSSNSLLPLEREADAAERPLPFGAGGRDERHLLLLEPVEDRRAPPPSSSRARSRPGARRRARRSRRSTRRSGGGGRSCAARRAGTARSRTPCAPSPRPASRARRRGASRRAARRAPGEPSPSRGGRRGSGWPRPSRTRASPRSGASSSRSRPISSDVSASCEIRSIVASCSARTAPPPGGIFTCWSQPSSDDALSRSWISATRSFRSANAVCIAPNRTCANEKRESAKPEPRSRPTQLQGSWRESGSASADPDSDCATRVRCRRAGGGAPRTTSPSAEPGSGADDGRGLNPTPDELGPADSKSRAKIDARHPCYKSESYASASSASFLSRRWTEAFVLGGSHFAASSRSGSVGCRSRSRATS